MDAPFACWRCEKPGHAAAECQPPPAETETELKARFARYMELRIAGRISTAQKRAWVTAEWKAYKEERGKRGMSDNGSRGSSLCRAIGRACRVAAA